MTSRLSVRVAALTATTALISVMAAWPASAADGDIEVVNTETVQVYTSPSGEVETKRIYEQLALTGDGSVNLANPISTDGLRNLDGFGGFEVRDGNQIAEMTVDGEEHLRSVSDYTGDLPLDVSVEYYLDGERVEPGDVVGEAGELEVKYSVKNVTAKAQEVTFDDGAGGTVTKTVDVPIPMVGSLTTTAPEDFTDVASEAANMAGDGKGGTKMSFTMTLFPPIGSDTAEFGYSANISDGVVPRTSISALPVNPLESPTFAGAAASYQGGADSGVELANGAAQIDSNLLKLRDGAGELLAGLIKLNEGALQLEKGLADKAAPGSERLADGAGELHSGLGELSAGSEKLAAGTGKAADGGNELATGLGKLEAGAGELNTGLGKLEAGSDKLAGGFNSPTGEQDLVSGSQKLVAGLEQIQGGLQLLSSADGLPKAEAGAKALSAGVDALLVGLGDPSSPNSLLGGMTAADDGATAAHAGAQQIDGGLGQLVAKLPVAKGGVDQINAGIAEALSPGGSLDRLRGGIEAAKNTAGCSNDPQCVGTLNVVLDGVTTMREKLVEANGGLGQVSAGLGDAIVGATALKSGSATLVGGLERLAAGTGQLLAGLEEMKFKVSTQLKPGLEQLVAGLTAAVSGVSQLSTGSSAAVEGATALQVGIAKAGDGAALLAGGLDQASAGSGLLADGSGAAAAGGDELASGLGKLDAGAGELSAGAGLAEDGSGRIADGAEELAAGLVDAAVGSGKLAAGLGTAADGAPKLVDGAQRLSDEGTSKLVDAGQATAQEYGEMYATIAAGAERAQSEKMVFGAPADALGLAAYSYEIKGEDGESGRNLARGLGALAIMGAGGAAFALRRRLI